MKKLAVLFGFFFVIALSANAQRNDVNLNNSIVISGEDVDIDLTADFDYSKIRETFVEKYPTADSCALDSMMSYLNAEITYYDAKESKSIQDVVDVYKDREWNCTYNYSASDVFMTIRTAVGSVSAIDINYMGKDNKVQCIDVPNTEKIGECSFMSLEGDVYKVKVKLSYITISKNSEYILKAQVFWRDTKFFKGTQEALWYHPE